MEEKWSKETEALDPGFKFRTGTLGKLPNNTEAAPQLGREGDRVFCEDCCEKEGLYVFGANPCTGSW